MGAILYVIFVCLGLTINNKLMLFLTSNALLTNKHAHLILCFSNKVLCLAEQARDELFQQAMSANAVHLPK
jgi:hypothetical protein